MTAQETMAGPTSPQSPDSSEPLVDTRLVLAYYAAALTFMTISMLGGLLMALQLVDWNPFKGVEYLSPGRWRMVHTNAIAYGFLANAFLGTLHWTVPRLCMRPLTNRYLSYAIFVAWQGVVLATAVGILMGHAQAVEWGETPTMSIPSHSSACCWWPSTSWGRSCGRRVRCTFRCGTSWRPSSGPF